MTQSNQEKIKYQVENSIATLTINRPEVMNAIDLETHKLLQSLLKRADYDEAVKVIVLTGSGKSFCAGGDIKGMKGQVSFGDAKRVYSVGRHLIELLMSIEKPLIARVNGTAVGLGATVALFCDVVCMTNDARIGDRHVNVGLVAGDGGAAIWPLLIGPARAKEMLMTGKLISGTEAERIGLVAHAVEADKLDETVLEVAQTLIDLPPYAVRATRAAVNKILQQTVSSVLDPSLAYEHLSMKTNDHQEAVTAFIEKRQGTYTGN